jgi:hypothetical protein
MNKGTLHVIRLQLWIQGSPELATQYIYSFYWSTLTLTTIGSQLKRYCIFKSFPKYRHSYVIYNILQTSERIQLILCHSYV